MEIILRNTSAIAKIDTKGAELKSFQDGFGTEYMWQADTAFWGRTSPVLFPIVGNLRNNKTIIEGKEYTIEKHGFLRDAEFRLIYQTEEKAIFSFMANEETLKQYPFRFHLQMTYLLQGCDLEIIYDVFNMDQREMPFCLGAHPAFRVPVNGNEPFENYYIGFADEEKDPTSLVYDLEKLHWDTSRRVPRLENNRMMLNYQMFDQDAVFFDHLTSSRIVLASVLSGRGIQVDLKGFPTVAFWTPIGKRAPFLCIEPWCGCAVYDCEDDELLHKTNIQIAKPDEKKSYSMKISML